VFTERTNWHRQPNLLHQTVERIRADKEPLFDLTASNPTRCGIAYPEGLMPALGMPESLHYDPVPKGMLSARNAVAEYYHQKGLSIDPGNILLTAGTSEAYAMVFRLLCEPGDEALVPVPSYPLFDFLARLNDVVIRPYDLSYDGEWHVDISSVSPALTDRTRAILAVSPHNPTGMFLKHPDLRALSSIAAERGLALVLDEVFADYAFAGDDTRIISGAGNQEALTFTLNGLSKLAGLPQMKLGWIVVSGPPALRDEALGRLEIVADTYLSVNTPVQNALPRLMELGAGVRGMIIGRTRRNLTAMRRLVTADTPCTVLSCEGGWNAVVRVPRTRSGEEWALELLTQERVYVHPGYFFDFRDDNVLVVSLLPDPLEFEEGVKRMVSCISR